MGTKVLNEATGVYVGILQEDMIDTVKRTKKMYCNVLISDFYNVGCDYPLTYVPLWGMVLPLKRGDKVLVKFNQNNLKYPILYKNDSELKSDIYMPFTLPADTTTTQDSVSVIEIGDNSYIIKTKSYTVFHNDKSACIIMTDSGETYVCGQSINILSSLGNIEIKSTTGQVNIGNQITSLGKILNGMLTILNTTLATQGAPVAHTVVPGQFTQQMVELQSLMNTGV